MSERNPTKTSRQGFTLLEVILSMVAISLVLGIAQGLLSHATRLRENAAASVRDSRSRARVASIVRDDLSNALVSGGVIASSVMATTQGASSGFPGYLRFTTVAVNDSTKALTPDVREVKYTIQMDSSRPDRRGGIMTRDVDGNILASIRESARSDAILTNVKSFETTFFDGTNWVNSWDNSDDETNLPLAVRVRIQQAALIEGGAEPNAIDILVPWGTRPFIKSISASTSNSTAAVNSPVERRAL